MVQTRSGRPVFYALFFFSGGAALGYQLVWARMFAPYWGHEMPAVLAVVSAFLGGMALGASSLAPLLSRSPRPGRWYGGLELLIGGWGFVVVAILPPVSQLAVQSIGLEPPAWRQWGAAFAFPFVLLLPSTLAMGATFPAMERWLAPAVADERCVGGMYAANTLGAVAGVLLGTFALMPAVGLRGTALVLGTVNLLCGVAALALDRCAGEPVRRYVSTSVSR